MTNNVSAVWDNAYNYSMWVELYNTNTTTSYNQSAFYFTDDLTQPRKWNPAYKLVSPNGFSVLWFERGERSEHANFKLEGEGGRLYLLNSSAVVIDSVAYPKQYRNISYGRITNGSNNWVYFEQFNTMIKPQMREEFEYKGRSRRPPKDTVNALISFLYALLLNDCRSALETVGLDPQLGFFHVVRPGRPALALDLLEEFRAVLGDRLALTLINRGQLRQKDFDFRPGGAVMLNDTGRKTVILAYQERKKETLQHPVLGSQVEIGLLPLLQARMLARYLRGDVEAYIPFFNK